MNRKTFNGAVLCGCMATLVGCQTKNGVQSEKDLGAFVGFIVERARCLQAVNVRVAKGRLRRWRIIVKRARCVLAPRLKESSRAPNAKVSRVLKLRRSTNLENRWVKRPRRTVRRSEKSAMTSG